MFEQFLVTELFALLLVFARIGSGLMVMPGFGEAYVLPRARLLLALALSLIMMPVMTPRMPEIPNSPMILFVMLAGEIMVGIALGLVRRFLIGVLHIAGMLISMQSGLALATQFDITQASQGSLIGNLLAITAVVMLFTMDLHYVMLRGLSDSYSLFPPGVFPPVEDFANYFSRLTGDIFEVGVRLAAPVMVMGLLLYVGAGVLSRLMPNMQVFFIILPPQIFLSFFLLMAVLTAMMLSFANFYSGHLESFLENM